MSAWSALVFAGLAGFGAGWAHFGGLRWTIRRALASTRPVRWLFASFVTRLALVVAVLGLAAQGRSEGLVAAFVGIVLARAFVLARARRGVLGTPVAVEVNHA